MQELETYSVQYSYAEGACLMDELAPWKMESDISSVSPLLQLYQRPTHDHFLGQYLNFLGHAMGSKDLLPGHQIAGPFATQAPFSLHACTVHPTPTPKPRPGLPLVCLLRICQTKGCLAPYLALRYSQGS